VFTEIGCCHQQDRVGDQRVIGRLLLKAAAFSFAAFDVIRVVIEPWQLCRAPSPIPQDFFFLDAFGPARRYFKAESLHLAD